MITPWVNGRVDGRVQTLLKGLGRDQSGAIQKEFALEMGALGEPVQKATFLVCVVRMGKLVGCLERSDRGFGDE